MQLDQLKRVSQKPSVLEITSEEPGAGKTHLLYLLAAIAVLPRSHAGLALNGMHSTIVVLDTDNRFCVQRLVQIMRHYIERQCKNHPDNISANPNETSKPSLDEATTSYLISTSLQHIHIFRPQSLPSLLANLSSLPTYLLTPTDHHSSPRSLHSILLDSATAFYWNHRAAEETISQPQPTYPHLIHTLHDLALRFSCPIIATTTSPFALSASSAAEAGVGFRPPASRQRPFMPRSWSEFVGVRLVVARAAVPRFALGLSVEEALVERGVRQREVGKGRFVAVVAGAGSGDGGGGFGFRIGEEGVDVE